MCNYTLRRVECSGGRSLPSNSSNVNGFSGGLPDLYTADLSTYCDLYPIDCTNESGFCPLYPCEAIRSTLSAEELRRWLKRHRGVLHK